ncbi:MAG TPA: hypothetical protein VKY73_05785 [Polyangiaceae bacterium]|nr:hypothetical protein [Polyangiaceae bacterium]
MPLMSLVEPLVKLVLTIIESALRSDDPRRYVERRLQAELAHKAAQETARKLLAKREEAR